MGESEIASNVARAMAVAFGGDSPRDARAAAISYLDTIKSGDVHILANASFLLVKKDWPSEIRLQAFKMLQHLVRLRWDQLNSLERRNFANLAVNLMSEIVDPSEEWALKSQTSALVAEIVRREGSSLWQELHPSLVNLSRIGPIQAELVSMMLRWLPEDITVHNEDLEGDRRRFLLRWLTESLQDILPLLYTLLEGHYGAAVLEAGKNQMENAKQHALAVIAAVNAVNTYAEWAPLPDLAKFGIIHGCGFLLSSPDFRLHACEFFKLVSQRKRPADASPDFDSAMRNIFEILMNVAKDFLYKISQVAGENESEIEVAEYICESLVSLGSTNMQCITSDSTIVSFYLQQMLGFYQHSKLALHYQSLFFWLALMRDLTHKVKTASANEVGMCSGQADNGNINVLTLVNDGICSVLIETAFQRMINKDKIPHDVAFDVGSLELWSSDLDSKIDFSQYRSRLGKTSNGSLCLEILDCNASTLLVASQPLVECIQACVCTCHSDDQKLLLTMQLDLIRLIASAKPLITAMKVSDRITEIIRSLSLMPVPSRGLVLMESMQSALENIVSTIFDGSDEFEQNSNEVKIPLLRIFEGLLQQLVSLKWDEPSLVEVLGHYLDALGPFLRYCPDATGSVIDKLFELLTSLPFVVKDPSTSAARRARLQICTSFIRIAKAAKGALSPHMKGIASTMTYLQKEGALMRAEQNLLGEAFLIMAAFAGVQQQQEVLLWLLEPLSNQWTQPEWQDTYLMGPDSLVNLFSETQFMWSIFHTVTFFEKALKRSGFRNSNPNLENGEKTNSVAAHPMSSHLPWMLPPLIKLLRAIHSLWSSSVIQALPGEVKAAMAMSDVDRNSLLGEGKHKLPKGALAFADGSQMDSKEACPDTIESVRNWLRGTRESGYSIMGLSATLGDSFFRSMDPNTLSVALMENIKCMEFRHIKQMLHFALIPLIKHCPADLWDLWLERLLYPLLLHVPKALSSSWSSLLQEGNARTPDLLGIEVGSDLKVEVMEEKLLRDLTREICSLLSALAAPGLNVGLPSLEPTSQVGHVANISLRNLDAFAHSSMVGFLMNKETLAVPALQICVDAFGWTDSEAMSKVSSFCGVVIHLAILTSNVELREFVCKDLFSAVIRGLTLESNAVISADLIGLCREIFVYLSGRDSSPRQILLSLPCITPQEFLAFEEALSKTGSPKEQKQLIRSLLILATGNMLKALASQKAVNVITNVTMRSRDSDSNIESSHDEGQTIGLAAIT